MLDPAHGGTDTGARGATGVAEKDIVLQFARTVRAELVRQNIRVVTTRDDDSNPSYDARAAIANGYRDAIFISIHVSSTGNAGTARAYYYRFSNSSVSAPASSSAAEGLAPSPINLPAVGRSAKTIRGRESPTCRSYAARVGPAIFRLRRRRPQALRFAACNR